MPNGSKAYAYQCGTGNVELLNIDSSNNVADSGISIPVSTSRCLFGTEQLATDAQSVFLSTSGPITVPNTPPVTFTGITAINVRSNKVTAKAITGAPGGIAVKGSIPSELPGD